MKEYDKHFFHILKLYDKHFFVNPGWDVEVQTRDIHLFQHVIAD